MNKTQFFWNRSIEFLPADRQAAVERSVATMLNSIPSAGLLILYIIFSAGYFFCIHSNEPNMMALKMAVAPKNFNS